MEFFTVKDAATRLGVSERFIADELRRKNLRGSKLPGRLGWRLKPADLEAYVDARANVTVVRRPRQPYST